MKDENAVKIIVALGRNGKMEMGEKRGGGREATCGCNMLMVGYRHI